MKYGVPFAHLFLAHAWFPSIIAGHNFFVINLWLYCDFIVDAMLLPQFKITCGLALSAIIVFISNLYALTSDAAAILRGRSMHEPPARSHFSSLSHLHLQMLYLMEQ